MPDDARGRTGEARRWTGDARRWTGDARRWTGDARRATADPHHRYAEGAHRVSDKPHRGREGNERSESSLTPTRRRMGRGTGTAKWRSRRPIRGRSSWSRRRSPPGNRPGTRRCCCTARSSHRRPSIRCCSRCSSRCCSRCSSRCCSRCSIRCCSRCCSRSLSRCWSCFRPFHRKRRPPRPAPACNWCRSRTETSATRPGNRVPCRLRFRRWSCTLDRGRPSRRGCLRRMSFRRPRCRRDRRRCTRSRRQLPPTNSHRKRRTGTTARRSSGR